MKAATITGVFKGSHGSEGGGIANTTLTGTYNPKSGEAKGTMTGTATYEGFDNKTLTARVTGTFTGRTKGEHVQGVMEGHREGSVNNESERLVQRRARREIGAFGIACTLHQLGWFWCLTMTYSLPPCRAHGKGRLLDRPPLCTLYRSLPIHRYPGPGLPHTQTPILPHFPRSPTARAGRG